MKKWNEYLKPVVVLLVICIIVGAVLAFVNSVTAPRIAENEERAANETYYAVLPEADSFTSIPCAIDGVTAVLRADNGTGYVITAQSRGYGGEVPAAVAFDNDGTILAVIMMDNSETPGMGQKVTGSDFTAQFSGRSAQVIENESVDMISGATISSKAAISAINLAIQAYCEVCGGEAG